MSVKQGKKRCCIHNCLNRNESLSYHSFPKDQTLRQKWVDAISAAQVSQGMKGAKPLDFGLRICSKHFLKTDYFNSAVKKRKRHLKRFTVPTIFENTKVTDETLKDDTNKALPKQTFSHLSPEERTEFYIVPDHLDEMDFDIQDPLPSCKVEVDTD